MFVSKLRKPVDKFAPVLGRLYREIRDITSRRRSVTARFGFELAGDPTMLDENWEAEEISAFTEFAQACDVVVDVGANVGFYTCLAASYGKDTLAFEPSRRNLRFLYRNLWNNHFAGVEVYPLALAGHSGMGRIFGYGGIASLVSGWAQSRETRSEVVPVNTLDHIISGRLRDRKLLIKVDVEGLELDVLAGAEAVLNFDPKPVWIVEILLRDDVIPGGVNRRFCDIFNLFWERGYVCRRLSASRAEVTKNDIDRWYRNGRVEGGAHDFLFSAAEAR